MPKDQILISFYLRLHNGNGCLLNLPPTCTLQDTLVILAEQRLTLPSAYRLIVNGKHVRDYSMTIKQVGITSGSIVHVEKATQERIKSISKIDVAIFLEGEKIVIQTQYSDTILSVKQRIFELSGISPQEQLLVFKGRKLNNSQTLKHCRIQPDSLICLSLISPNDSNLTIKKRDSLTDSVVSLNKKASSSSRTTLFRSDSIGQRKYQDNQPIDVAIKQQRLECYPPSSIEKQCQLKNSITFNVFQNEINPFDCPQVYSQSVENQIDLITLKPKIIQPESQFSQI